jgi:predicted Zn-dependent protease
MGYTQQGNLQSYDNAFRSVIGSFDRLRNSAALSVKPAVVQLVRVPSQMTLAQFNQQYPSSISIEELAVANELEGPDSVVARGRTIKRVVGGRQTPPSAK